MSNLWNDQDSFLPIYNKLNAVVNCLKITETNAVITAGTVTSFSVATITKNCLHSGTHVWLIDSLTGTAYDLELDNDVQAADVVLTIGSFTFPYDVASGSGIYVNIIDILNAIY